MPELPEVETIIRELHEARMIGLTIIKAKVFWDRSVAYPEKSLFCQIIKGQSISDISRRGKYIVFSLKQDTLLVHLRMTGKFTIENDICEENLHERVRLYLSDKRILRFMDQRKFGKWHLTPHPEQILRKIGLEPLSPEFTSEVFKSLLKGCNRQIKPFLLDQSKVAGLGNIYVDEALWKAKIHPSTSAASLNVNETHVLHDAIVSVLRKGIANTGTTLGSAQANYYSVSGRRGSNQHQLKVFRRNGLPCPRCGAIIQKLTLAQRGTHFCPSCQIVRHSR